MVKRQKERQYQSAREHRAHQTSRSGSSSLHRTATTSSGHTRPLPFHVCALSLNPYADPVATPSGVIFDASVLTPHLMKTGKDPVTGKPLTTRDLITLVMDRNVETGQWQCPVLEKAFTDRTKVVAIKQTPPGNVAHVYSYEAVQELNFKPKSYEDLTTGQKFDKKTDVLMLQDPDDEELCRLRDINNFAHIRNGRGGGSGGGRSAANKDSHAVVAGGSGDVRYSVTATRIMEQIKRKRDEEAEAERKKRRQILQSNSGDGGGSGSNDGGGRPDAKQTAATTSAAGNGDKIYTTDLLGTSLTSGKASSSLTSTSVAVAHTNDLREATAEEILESRFQTLKKLKKKGFVRLATTVGIIDLELHCDIVPRTTSNFLGLVEAGKYDGSVFHRCIKNFMIQGGKPANKAEKEESLWGDAFADEFDNRLTHSGPGVLSMANAGAGTNKRQFFLTFKSCTHLDRKHSVFGRVVKGLDVLRTMEAVPTGKGDRPLEEIKIITAEILGSNPAREAEDAERVRIQERREARIREREERKASALGRDYKASVSGVSDSGTGSSSKLAATNTGAEKKKKPSGVGKYLPKGAIQSLDALGGGNAGTGGRGGGFDGAVGKAKSSRGSGDIASLPGVAAAAASVTSQKLKKIPTKKSKAQWDFSGW